MFSQIPIPTPIQQQPGGIPALYNQLRTSSAEAKYAPYQQYANALLTNQQAQWLPYQYRMQALSNPMLWMAAQNNPQLQQQLTQMMSNPMTGIGSSMPNIPQPGASSGIFGMAGNLGNALLEKLGITSPSSNNVAANSMGSLPVPAGSTINPTATQPNRSDQQTSGGSPLVPATTGNAIGGTITAGYTENPHKQGTLIQDPNNPTQTISVPTSKQTSQLQSQISAAQRTVPQLQSLADLWKPFLTIQGKAKTAISGAKNLFGMSDTEAPSQYTDAKMAALTTVESYLKSIGVPVTVDIQDKLNGMIEPTLGEGPTGYTNRIQRETNRIINDFVVQAKQQLNQGYSTATQPSQNAPQTQTSTTTTTPPQAVSNPSNVVSNTGVWPSGKDPINVNDPAIVGQASPPGTKWMVRPDGVQVPVHKSRMAEARKLNYRGINE